MQKIYCKIFISVCFHAEILNKIGTKLSVLVANSVENLNINFCCHWFCSFAYVQDSLSTIRINQLTILIIESN